MWAELSSDEWDAIVTRLRSEVTQSRIELSKARQAEAYERNMAQREWLEHQDERRRWLRMFLAGWILSNAMTLVAMGSM